MFQCLHARLALHNTTTASVGHYSRLAKWVHLCDLQVSSPSPLHINQQHKNKTIFRTNFSSRLLSLPFFSMCTCHQWHWRLAFLPLAATSANGYCCFKHLAYWLSCPSWTTTLPLLLFKDFRYQWVDTQYHEADCCLKWSCPVNFMLYTELHFFFTFH